MKCLFFLSLALLFLSSKVSSQNLNMFEFHITCKDNASPACNAMDVYNRAGQIISDNLILTAKIIVEITVEKNSQPSWSATSSMKVGSDIDGIRRNYPTALLKQIRSSYEGPDILITINSNYDLIMFYPGNGQIQPNQHDVLEVILHELQHGLGFETTWRHLKGNNLFPEFDYTVNNGVMTFLSFKENLFDHFLGVGKNVERTTPYIQALNRIAGPSGKTYKSIDDFYNQIINQQQQQGKSYTKFMLSMATSPKRINFLAKGGKHIVLETTSTYHVGSSISHFARNIYSKTRDFLLIPEGRPGKTLEDKVAAFENNPGEGMGPNLRALLETMGYQLRIPVNPPADITTTNSTDSKLKSIVNNRNKKKRIVAL